MGVGGQRHASAALYPRERPGTHWTGGWVSPRVGLEGCGKSAPTGIQSPDRSVRSEPLYRLNYPGPQINKGTVFKFLLIKCLFCVSWIFVCLEGGRMTVPCLRTDSWASLYCTMCRDIMCTFNLRISCACWLWTETNITHFRLKRFIGY